MKLSITKPELIRGLSRIQAIVEKRNSMPILANVLLDARSSEAKDETGTLEFAATDLETGTVETLRTVDGKFPDITADILPKDEPVFSIGVNPTYLAELCKSLAEITGKDGASVRLDFHGKDRAFTLTAETADHKAIGVLMPVILD